jgi:hypothetical protein
LTGEQSTQQDALGRTIPEQGDLRVWLDDDLVDRAAPEGWIHVTTAPKCIDLLDTGRVVELSLDHDLGDDRQYGRGIDVPNWLGQQQEVHGRLLWPSDGITIHSANPSGRDAMARAIKADAGRRQRVIESRTAGGKPRFLFESLET